MTQQSNPKPNLAQQAPPAETSTKTRPATRKRPAKKKRSKRRQRISQSFSADEKARAVLAAWTERLNQSEICRQLEVNYVTFQNWQKRAMEGMLQALEDHARLSDGAALSPRLRKLMDRHAHNSKTPAGLDQRLKALQEPDDNPANP